MPIYTDGLKDPLTGCIESAFGVPDQGVKVTKSTTDHLAVYTVEMQVVLLALQWVEEVRPDRVVICSDSWGVLMCVQSFNSRCICWMRCSKQAKRLIWMEVAGAVGWRDEVQAAVLNSGECGGRQGEIGGGRPCNMHLYLASFIVSLAAFFYLVIFVIDCAV